MTFSIAIVVKGDRGIQLTLCHIEPIVKRHKNVEVVVVDASAPTALRDIARQFMWARWFYYKNRAGKRLTIPEQRNMAIKKSRGDVIIFVDANCVPDPKWFTVMERAFTKEGHVMVAGMVTSAGKESTYNHGYEARKDNASLEECGAANLAVTRHILKQLKGFDSNLSYGEDVDLVWRARDAGYQVIFKKNAIISHDWGTLKDEMRRTFRYGQARINLYKKHPQRWRGLLGIDSIVIIYPLYILLLPLAVWVPAYPLVILIPLVKNRRKQAVQTTFLHLIYGLGVIKGVFKGV